jgi:hypothetical protein
MASEDSRIGAGCTIWPFLLIVRTERIVTSEEVPSDTRSFQHIAGCTWHVTVPRGNSLRTTTGFITLGPL